MSQNLSLEQSNLLMRQRLIQTSPKMLKKVGSFTANAGSTTRIKLLNVGLVTRIILKVTASVTIGTANATISPKGAHALISKVKLVDFDQTDRVNLTGFQLWQRNTLRNEKQCLAGYSSAPTNATGTSNALAGLTVPLTNPSVPTAQATANLAFFTEVPVCPDVLRGDLRGMILAQTTVGELALSIDLASSPIVSNGSDDVVYNGAATTTATYSSATIDVFQEYYFPQRGADGVVPIPPLDIATVYELTGNLRSSDNLASGSEKLLSLPNVRQIVGIYASYLNNSVLGGSSGNDMTKIRLIANGNNILSEYDMDLLYYEQRRRLGADLPKGVYFIDLAQGPIQTNLYGNVQLGLTPTGTVTAGASVEVAYESFYVKGQALSGLSQSG